MATVWATAIAHPPYRYEQDAVRDSLPLWLAADGKLLSLARRVFENAAVQTRYGCRPLLDLAKPLSVTEASQLYQQQARALGEQVARACLERAVVDPGMVDLIITTSCTGFMIPSLDAYLANALKRKKVKLDHPLISFERALVAFTEGNCRVIIERSIFGYSIFTSGDYAVQIEGGKVTASPKSGAIGRMPIDPYMMPYAGFLFSDAVAVMDREHKLLNKVGSIQLREKEVVVTSAQ